MASSTSTVKSISISGTSSIISRGVTALTYLLIVSLVSPSGLGTITLGLAVYAMLGPFRDFGLTPAIIARKELSPRFLADVSTIRLAVSGVLSLIGVLLAFVLPEVFALPQLLLILLLITGAIFVEFFGFIPNALLQRDLRFKEIAVADVSSVLVMACTTIIAAISGYEIFALFIGNLAYAITRTAIVNLQNPVRAGLNRRAFGERKTISFGGQMVAAGIAAYLIFNINALVLGKVDIVALGFYGLAFLWATTPADVASATLGRVLLPTYSVLKIDKKVAFEAYLRTMRHLSIVAFGGFLVLLTVSPWLIDVLYGNAWEESVPLLLVLLVFSLGRTMSEPAGSLLVAFERVSVVLGASLVSLLALFALVYPVAIEYGALGCAWLLVAVYLLYVGLLWQRTLKMFDEGPESVVRVIWRPLAACLASVLLMILASSAVDDFLIETAINGGLVLLYVLVLYVLCPTDVRATLAYIRSAANPHKGS